MSCTSDYTIVTHRIAWSNSPKGRRNPGYSWGDGTAPKIRGWKPSEQEEECVAVKY